MVPQPEAKKKADARDRNGVSEEERGRLLWSLDPFLFHRILSIRTRARSLSHCISLSLSDQCARFLFISVTLRSPCSRLAREVGVVLRSFFSPFGTR